MRLQWVRAFRRCFADSGRTRRCGFINEPSTGRSRLGASSGTTYVTASSVDMRQDGFQMVAARAYPLASGSTLTLCHCSHAAVHLASLLPLATELRLKLVLKCRHCRFFDERDVGCLFASISPVFLQNAVFSLRYRRLHF